MHSSTQRLAIYRGPIFQKSYDELTKNLRRSLIYENLMKNLGRSYAIYEKLMTTLQVSYENVKFASSDVIQETFCQRLLLVE